MSGLKRIYNAAVMSPESKYPKIRKMFWRDIYMLLAIAGFTVCMALFNGMYPGANPELEPQQHVASQPLVKYVMPEPEPGP
ncbi:MAG: hypothetical protein F4X93_03300 [Proteobacteria bacterium]|nr:hypothetical protein [Pseudomonadota bacterium]